jgi:uncharacterized protein (TIGR00725 family)
VTVAVIGSGRCDQIIYELARNAGRALAQEGYRVICGGLGGVMEAVCRGVREGGGLSIGILPGDDTQEANVYVDIPVATGMGIGRNIIIIRSADVVLAVGGSYGTLSEIAYALQLGKPVIGLQTWDVSEKILKVSDIDQALDAITSIGLKK